MKKIIQHPYITGAIGSLIATFVLWLGGIWPAIWTKLSTEVTTEISITFWKLLLIFLVFGFILLKIAFRMINLEEKLKSSKDSQTAYYENENKNQTKQNPFDALVSECKDSDAAHIKLTRKPEVFMWVWVYYLDKLRKERNTHDTVNLFNIIGSFIHNPGNGNGNVGMDEVLFTLKCMYNRGYITLEKSDYGHCSPYDNNNIKYNKQFDELIKNVTFHQNGNELSMSWE